MTDALEQSHLNEINPAIVMKTGLRLPARVATGGRTGR